MRRLLIARDARLATPEQVVARMCAMQAQDYLGSLWAVGLRCPAGARDADIERAIAERRIVRTWPMRGTLHFVAAEDVRWLLRLLSARPIGRARKRHRDLGLTDAVFERGRELFSAALTGGRQLTRPEAMAMLEADGIPTAEQRGYHVLWRLALDGLLCCGPMRGKQQTFVLLDEWVPPGPAEQDSPPRDEALARLAGRYLAAHGPATVADLAWWAGITKADARIGLAGTADAVGRFEADGAEYWLPAGTAEAAASASPLSEPDVHLLPGFDEYLLGYTDRRPQLAGHYATFASMVTANGMLSSTVVVDGRVAGTWKRTLKRDRVEITVRAFRELTADERDGLAQAAEEYGSFVGRTSHVELTRA